ncbi:MAG: hypothetical protein R2849_09905 [Thermomicrobiales bacterium]
MTDATASASWQAVEIGAAAADDLQHALGHPGMRQGIGLNIDVQRTVGCRSRSASVMKDGLPSVSRKIGVNQFGRRVAAGNGPDELLDEQLSRVPGEGCAGMRDRR